jgi:hypothetical protein
MVLQSELTMVCGTWLDNTSILSMEKLYGRNEASKNEYIPAFCVYKTKSI